LVSCGASQESWHVNGIWDQCSSPNSTDYIYEELIINNTEYQKSIYNTLDSECTDIETIPIIRDVATLTLDNPHYTESGLYVYDLTLTNITRENSFSSISISNWYSITHRDNNKLYSGRATGTNDGSSEENRHLEVDLESYLTKI